MTPNVFSFGLIDINDFGIRCLVNELIFDLEGDQMLQLKQISKYYFTGSQVVQALRRISFSVDSGEFLCITGVSGSGKSTLLNVIGGLDTYEEGALYVDGHDFSHYTTDEMERYRKENIGFVFQDFQIIDHYTVYQNVEIALSFFDMSKSDKRKRVMELLGQVGLRDFSKRKASTLSGGEKQRTVLARTLAKNSPIILCDEPTGNLNETAAKEIFSLLQEISKERTVIVVTHDHTLVEAYASRKIRLHDGEIIEDQSLNTPPKPMKDESVFIGKRNRRSESLAIAWTNLVTMPKLTLFAGLTVLIMLCGVLFTWGIGVIERNKAVDVDNPYFSNASPMRIIVTNFDKSPLTEADRSLIASNRLVRGVLNCDAVFDSRFIRKTVDPLTQQTMFQTFLPVSSLALETSDLLAGRLPERSDEAVVGEKALLSIGVDIAIANQYQLPLTSSLQTDQRTFRIVGIVREEPTFDDFIRLYVDASGWDALSPSVIQERSEIEIRIEGTRVFDLASDSWVVENGTEEARKEYVITVPIWISEDAGLADDEVWVYDMFFFDICRDFGYKKEIRDDMDAGLCSAAAFLESHQLSLRTNHMFSSNLTFSPIVLRSSPQTDDDRSFKFYMNATTFEKYFGVEPVQTSVIVRHAYDAKRVSADLRELGFDVFVPSLVLSEWTSLTVLIRNVGVTVITLVICIALLMVGWVVLKNVVKAKRADYLILRSLGMDRSGMRSLLRFEWLILIAGAVVVLSITAIIGAHQFVYVRQILAYLRWYDYAGSMLLVLFFFRLFTSRDTTSIFQTSVMKAMKGGKR
jgi:ABC-type lipoprotein export system ATPase subunit